MCMNESGTEIFYSYGEHSFVLWDIQKGLVVCDILCVKIKNDLQIHENSLTDDKVRLIQNINDHLYVFSTETSTKKARMNINKNPGSSLKNSVTPGSNSPILTT